MDININPQPSKRRATSYARVGVAKKRAVARRGYTAVAKLRSTQIASVGEMKYFDSERAALALNAQNDWTDSEFDPNTTQEATPITDILGLFSPKKGTSINNRIGRQAKVHKIKIKGHISVIKQVAQTTGDLPAYVRIILVQDDQTNSAQMAGEDLMADPVTATAAAAINSFQDLKNFGRFQVLKDKIITMQNPNLGNSTAVTNNIVQGLVVPFHFNVVFKTPVVVRFNAGDTGKIGDIVDHSWHIIAMTTSEDLAPQINYMCRVCFKE